MSRDREEKGGKRREKEAIPLTLMSSSTSSGDSGKNLVADKMIIWEGEWPKLKQSISSARAWTQATIEANQWGKSVLISAKDHLEVGFQTTDSAITSVSSSVSSLVKEQPWTAPAFGIGACSTFITVKSMSVWGFSRGIRNGLLFGVVASASMYPQETRQLLFDFSPAEKLRQFNQVN